MFLPLCSFRKVILAHSRNTHAHTHTHALSQNIQVVQFLKAPEYSHFKRIVFDTAPTGHTLRLLSLPDFLDASIGERGGPRPAQLLESAC